MATVAAVQRGSGKERLMAAALRLSGRTRSLHALGIRELAREAGVNPNTFYRHFADHDELGLAVLEQVVRTLREPLRRLRREATEEALAAHPPLSADAPPEQRLAQVNAVIGSSLRRYFEFAAEHPEAFIVGGRELNGPSAMLRNAIREAMELFADDLAEDMEQMPLPDRLNRTALREIARFVIRQTFHVSLDYVEQPGRRETICRRLCFQVLMMLVGASALQRLDWREPGLDDSSVAPSSLSSS